MTSGSEKRQRDVTVTVRLTMSERAELDTLSSASGLTAGAYLRACAFGGAAGPRAKRRPPVDQQQLRQLLGELGRVGNNINQIAFHLNRGDAVPLPDIAQATGAFLDLRKAILSALSMQTGEADDPGGGAE